MIATVRMIAPIKLARDDVRPLVRYLADETAWNPVILASEQAILEKARLKGEIQIRRADRWFAEEEGQGDVFFADGHVLYLLASVENPRGGGGNNRPLEIGGFGSDETALAVKAKQLADDVKKGLSKTIDGRRLRHMKFDWSEPPAEVGRLDQIKEAAAESDDLHLVPASLADKAIEGAHFLAEQPARKILQEISQARIARERDITNRWKRRRTKVDVAQILKQAQRAGLLNSELIVECRETSAPIARLKDRSELTGPTGAIACASCGRPFNEELISEGYLVSKLGGELIRGSHWMTIWLTEWLVNLGVSLESIIWNISEDGEEIDLLVELAGQLWIFELKDRTFGAGDAHPFNYRRVRYKADAAVVVTTEKVDESAKRVFRELAERDEPGRPRRAADQPTYIEGLEAIKELAKVMSSASMIQVYQGLFPLSSGTGLDLGQLAARSLDHA